MKRYGYVRVSSSDQNEDRQLLVMESLGITQRNIYIDKQSGKNFERPAYKKMLDRINSKDEIYIESIDRLGRNYEEIIEQWRYINKELGAEIIIVDMPVLDTRKDKDLIGTFLTDIVLAILSYVAENERRNIRSRQREGIAAARIRGVKFGRPPQPLPSNFCEQYIRWKNKEITLKDAAKPCGMAASTFLYKARKYGTRKDGQK